MLLYTANVVIYLITPIFFRSYSKNFRNGGEIKKLLTDATIKSMVIIISIVKFTQSLSSSWKISSACLPISP